jgi:integrase
MLVETMRPQWRSEKHAAQWADSLNAVSIRGMRVDAVDLVAILRVLGPIWQTTPESASRLRGRIEAVLDYAAAHGWRNGPNAAAWKALEHVLPRRPKLARKHHAALGYAELPSFLDGLRRETTVARLALEFIVLTAARSGEARLATWAEIDLDRKLWTLPPHRTKTGVTHEIPLAARAVEILIARGVAQHGLIFPGAKAKRPIDTKTLCDLLPGDATTHGLRSTFRDWAGDHTAFPREVIESALAHAVGNATEAAYRRSNALEKRRELMSVWAAYCDGARADNVIALKR